jgi:hypothetical protein
VQPDTRYARLGGDRIAYQVLGQGPPDLVTTTGSFSQIDISGKTLGCPVPPQPGVVLAADPVRPAGHHSEVIVRLVLR